ncbi:uncharacterized protein LOC117341093 [Pecten maximus]|uniref:uncharacterized protein LOC117341093 n=1 Tax=Pecten maximus TaxID=6579 RepID=UPI001458FE95|nr:uncharacterized protein LOC117341093 [Pecten maximus]XP_033758819.1 uncharacterized protein LOC117341093 [Pecten maximus]
MRLAFIATVVAVVLQVTTAWLFDIDQKGVNSEIDNSRQYSRDVESMGDGESTEPEEEIPLILRILRSDENDVVGAVSELHARALSNRRNHQQRRQARSHWRS